MKGCNVGWGETLPASLPVAVKVKSVKNGSETQPRKEAKPVGGGTLRFLFGCSKTDKCKR